MQILYLIIITHIKYKPFQFSLPTLWSGDVQYAFWPYHYKNQDMGFPLLKPSQQVWHNLIFALSGPYSLVEVCHYWAQPHRILRHHQVGDYQKLGSSLHYDWRSEYLCFGCPRSCLQPFGISQNCQREIYILMIMKEGFVPNHNWLIWLHSRLHSEKLLAHLRAWSFLGWYKKTAIIFRLLVIICWCHTNFQWWHDVGHCLESCMLYTEH